MFTVYEDACKKQGFVTLDEAKTYCAKLRGYCTIEKKGEKTYHYG
jgi:hypothetical protein